MPRRRLRLRYSSDEEDGEEVDNPSTHDSGVRDQLSTDTPQPPPPPPPTTSSPSANPSFNSNSAEPIAISDDEFIDVSDDLVPPSPPNFNPSPPPPPPPPGAPASSGSPIGEFLLRMGLRLRTEWLDSCLRGLERSAPRFSSLDLQAKAKLCFEQLFVSDMNHCGAGVLPRDVASMHLVELAGPFVLQVDEIINMSCPLKGRYQNAAPGFKRCLKLSMTDGVQRVFAMEYRPIKDLQVLAPAGLKVVISNVQIRHGLLMLVPEVIQVLGGVVEELEEARKRLVVEVNKPPRGRRARTGVAPSLATRATLTAWSSANGDANGHVNSFTSENVTPLHTVGQGDSFNASRADTGQRNINEPPASINVENTVARVEDMHIDTFSTSRERAVSNTSLHAESNLSLVNTVASRTSTIGSNMTAHNNGESATDRQTSSIVSHTDLMQREAFAVRNVSSVSDVDSSAVENNEVNNSEFILSRNMEIPFTYLANLSAKWAAVRNNLSSVRGKIKCFLTGVKKFQYKQRPTYELLCYVDDGSLISEILIDHKVVQKGIGHCPSEVSAALSSSDLKSVRGMKETLRQFQAFLANFEGTMLVEMNDRSSYPVALEMYQGCSASVAWLLFQRLKSSAQQTPPVAPTGPIDLSQS